MLAIYQTELHGVTDTKLAFGTPHGIVELLSPQDLRVAGAEETEQLVILEKITEDTKRTLYGGTVALQEVTKLYLLKHKA